jgi:hypothetical protein
MVTIVPSNVLFEAALVFWLYLDRIDKWIILDRCEIEFQHSVRRGLYAIENNYRGATFLTLQNVKILQQGCTVAVNIEYAAPRTSRTTIADTKPPLGKIQANSVVLACHNRYAVMEVPISLPFK